MTFVLESEKDANYLINEINIGLKSAVSSEQSQALLKFPILVHKYPFPVVINAIFSKIIDLFRDGSNFQRLTILHVCQQCAQHLDSGKVRNSDYVIKIVLGVCHSNDPTARALAVRLLASLPGLAADNRSVHSAICTALDSHWPVELDAAIWATNRLAPLSPALSRSAADRLTAALNDLGVDPRTKLAMYAACCCLSQAGGVAIAQLTDRLLGELADCPAIEGQSVLLRVLARLALISPDNLPRILGLHCQRLLGDDGVEEAERRPLLRRVLLANLLTMAGPAAAHHWTATEAQRLVRFLQATVADMPGDDDADGVAVLEEGLRVAGVLADGDACRLLLDAGLLQLLRQIVYGYGGSGYGVGVNAALDVAVQVAVATGDADLGEELSCLLADRIPTAVSPESSVPALDKLLVTWHALLSRFPRLGAILFTPDSLSALLGPSANWRLGMRTLRCLACMTHYRWQPRAACADWLAAWLRGQPSGSAQPDQIEAVCCLLFKVDCCREGGLESGPEHDQAVLLSLRALNNWQAYRVARAACKFGRLSVAGRIFAQLSSAQERPAFWLRGLALFCQAEAAGIGETRDAGGDGDSTHPLNCMDAWCESLREALACFVSANGCSGGDASTLPTGGGGPGGGVGTLWFPVAFTRRRFNFVSACQSFVTMAYQLRPGDRLASVQLEAAATEAEAEAAAVRKLRSACVDADAGSLAQLDCLVWQSAILAELMRAIASPTVGLPACPPLPGGGFDEGSASSADSECLPYACAMQCDRLRAIGDSAWDRLATLSRSQSSSSPEDARALLLDTLWRLLRSPLCLPRFFFQRLQRTRISLHVTPASKSAATAPELVRAGVDYVLKVEGVVSQSGPVLLRRVASVAVVVAVRPHSPGDAAAAAEPGGWQQRLTATIPVPTDYFSKEFVLSFDRRRPSLYLIKVHVHPIDRAGCQWSAVEKERVYVKVAA